MNLPRKVKVEEGSVVRSGAVLRAVLVGAGLFLGLAQGSFSVSPMRVDANLSGGQRNTFEFLVVNEDATQPHTIRYFPSGFEQQANGTYQLTLNPDTLRSCRTWFRLDTVEFSLGPKETRTVKVDLAVPPGVSGTKYGAVVFDEVGAARLTKDGAGVSLSFRTPAFVHVTVPGPNTAPGLQLVRLSTTPPSGLKRFLPRGSSGNSFGFTALLANTGSNLANVRGNVVLRGEHGRIVRSFPLAKGSILPGAAVEFLSLIPALAPGVYTADVTAWYGLPSPLRASVALNVGGESVRFDSVSAASDMNVETEVGVLELKAAPGGFHSGYLPVKNPGKTAARLRASMVPLIQDMQGDLLPAESASSRDCSGWLSLTDDTLIVEPGRSASVRFTCTVPADARGGYYSCVVLEQPADSGPETFISVPLLVNVRGGKRDAGITMSDPKTGPLRVLAQLRNKGEEYLRPSANVVISRAQLPNPVADFDWKNVTTLKCDQTDPVVLPGHELALTATCHERLTPGLYRVTVAVDMGQGLRQTESRTVTIR